MTDTRTEQVKITELEENEQIAVRFVNLKELESIYSDGRVHGEANLLEGRFKDFKNLSAEDLSGKVGHLTNWREASSAGRQYEIMVKIYKELLNKNRGIQNRRDKSLRDLRNFLLAQIEQDLQLKGSIDNFGGLEFFIHNEGFEAISGYIPAARDKEERVKRKEKELKIQELVEGTKGLKEWLNTRVDERPEPTEEIRRVFDANSDLLTPYRDDYHYQSPVKMYPFDEIMAGKYVQDVKDIKACIERGKENVVSGGLYPNSKDEQKIIRREWPKTSETFSDFTRLYERVTGLCDDPDYLVKNHSSLRDIFQDLCTGGAGSNFSHLTYLLSSKSDRTRPYHVAVFVNPNKLGETSHPIPVWDVSEDESLNWGVLKDCTTSDILGCMALLPNRKLAKQIGDIVSNRSKTNPTDICPVYDSRGRIYNGGSK